MERMLQRLCHARMSIMLTYMETATPRTSNDSINICKRACVPIASSRSKTLILTLFAQNVRSEIQSTPCAISFCASGQLSPEPAQQLALASEQNPFWSWRVFAFDNPGQTQPAFKFVRISRPEVLYSPSHSNLGSPLTSPNQRIVRKKHKAWLN